MHVCRLCSLQLSCTYLVSSFSVQSFVLGDFSWDCFIWCVLFYSMENALNILLLSYFTHGLFRSVLFSSQVLRYYPDVLLLLLIYISAWEHTLYIMNSHWFFMGQKTVYFGKCSRHSSKECVFGVFDCNILCSQLDAVNCRCGSAFYRHHWFLSTCCISSWEGSTEISNPRYIWWLPVSC